MLIYCPTEGRRLSLPRHYRKGWHIPCPRLLITVGFTINTTVYSAIRPKGPRIAAVRHATPGMLPLDHCDMGVLLDSDLLKLAARKLNIQITIFVHIQ